MKNKNIITILLIVFSFCFYKVYSYEDCSPLEKEAKYRNSLVPITPKSDINYFQYYVNRDHAIKNYERCVNEALKKAIYEEQQRELLQQQMQQLFELGNEKFSAEEYEEAINYYQKAIEITSNPNNENHKRLKNNMISCYNNLGALSIAKEDEETALIYFEKALNLDNKNPETLMQIGNLYFDKKDYKTALEYFKKAKNYSTNFINIDKINNSIDISTFRVNEIDAQKNIITDDPYSYKLPHVRLHNIQNARKNVYTGDKFKQSNVAIVAIIDDGININHEDLSENIRTNSGEKKRNGKDNDRNGYKDDYNGRNFVYNNNNIYPLGTHGTMVAGIIGAVKNNKVGIAGVVRDIKIMPIGVLNESGVSNNETIIKGINYAIDNGAYIINLSLGSTWLNYSHEYDKVIKRAYRKGIPVIIAAGNGDPLSYQKNGINTTKTKLSPICNNSQNQKSIIGVASLNMSGALSKRSNYGECVNFYALGEELFSTIIEGTGDSELPFFGYRFGEGTSFSTPIVAGIVGLGYNKYGKVRPDFIWDALKESMGTGIIIDAEKYLNILGEKIKNNPDNYQEIPLSTKEKIQYRIEDFVYYLKSK